MHSCISFGKQFSSLLVLVPPGSETIESYGNSWLSFLRSSFLHVAHQIPTSSAMNEGSNFPTFSATHAHIYIYIKSSKWLQSSKIHGILTLRYPRDTMFKNLWQYAWARGWQANCSWEPSPGGPWARYDLQAPLCSLLCRQLVSREPQDVTHEWALCELCNPPQPQAPHLVKSC